MTFEYPLDKDSDIRTYSVLRLFDRLSCTIPILLGDIKVATSFQESKKTLKNLRNKSKLALEEQGTNILYLSLGFIEWQENHGSHHSWVKSPLILVPVSLTVETLNAPFKLVRYGDDVVVNPTLLHLLSADYGIELPSFDPDKDTVEDYLKTLEDTVTGRTSLFSGLAYCADCGSKLYFCASKSIDKDAEFFRCSQYKDNRGKCTIHFIRNVVLEELVLTAIKNVAEYISQFEPVFLYLFAKQHKLSKQHNLKMAKQNLEQSKNRIAEIDRVLTKLYEDNALGKISNERFERLSATYELEQDEKELLALMDEIRNEKSA